MDPFSVLCLFTVLVALAVWKCNSKGFFYYFKWMVIYIILKWRKFTEEKPDVPIFASSKEEYLEKPRVWSKEKRFRRDSMLVFAAGPELLLVMESARGRYNSAVARVRLQLGPNAPVHQTTEADSKPRVCEEWTTDFLSLQCLEPMRRWRISYTGRLQSRNNAGQKEIKFAKINLIWAALTGPYHFSSDGNISALATAFADQPLTHLQLNLDSLGKGYEQWGSVWGSVEVGDSGANIHATSLRRHVWHWPGVEERTDLVGVADNGTAFSIGYNIASARTQLGHILYPDGRHDTIVGTSNQEAATCGDKFVKTFSSGCSSHVAYCVCSGFQAWGALHWAPARCTLDSTQAVCILLSYKRTRKEDLPQLPVLMHTLVTSEELVVSVDDSVSSGCASPSVVGGKAASLALLTHTAQSVLKNKVLVPAAFCLTVNAMRLQAESSPGLTSAVNLLSLVSTGREPGNLQEQCQHVVAAWQTVPMCPQLVSVLSGRVCEGVSYAVRSSAVDEDTQDSSAAGQNATVLGCVGVDAVVAAVHQCWASLFTYRSVQYRRQCGQPVAGWMGVVVQEMVRAESAGVMFTRHPVTGDPSRLVISADYGLGESVVSGSVDPDHIQVNIEDPNHLFIESITTGKKEKKMVVDEQGQVTEECVCEEESMETCVSRPQMIALAQVGLTLQHVFGWPRDIEWAINKGVIYLLQCRPISSQGVSADELKHELDSAVLPGDAFTTGNTGEVLPGASSVLSQSTAHRCVDLLMIRQLVGIQHRLWYNNSKLVNSHHHAFLSLYNTILKDAEEVPNMQQKVIEFAICGHRVASPEMQELAWKRRSPQSLYHKAHILCILFKLLFASKKFTNKAQKIGEEFKVNCDTFTSSASLYAFLTANYSHMLHVMKLHTDVTLASTLWQIVLFSILTEGNPEFSEENIQDIAHLLVGKQTVLSAQIPADIQELISIIKNCKKWEESTALSAEKFQVWLRINCPKAANFLNTMIQRYEHRNIRELDVMTRTWGLDPGPIITMIQAALKAPASYIQSNQKPDKSADDIVRDLKSPKKPLTRRLIRWFLGFSNSAAARREVTKDASLRVIHQFRQGYLRLARLMVEEGRLPSPELIFHLTHYELGVLVRTPSPTLIHKAVRRQRHWAEWDQLQFPEVMTNLPTPISFKSHPLMRDSVCVQGTLVCPGSVRGRACVLLSCVEAHTLQPGDILVTHSTDVGWTPLFPLLSGVVTELGGLISHGAVVAREYGLPCIVGATNATVVFKTGDEIYLDGTSGKIQKMSSAK